jgi:hypothetical protein
MRTINDMERYYYGAGNSMGYSYTGSELLKADAPLLSTTAGTYQAIYGRKVWSQLNQEFNAFSILPKKPWDRSGWRVVTAKPSKTVGGGIAENGTLPDTTKPTFQNVAAKPKTVAHSFDMSEVAIFLNDKDDGLGDIRSVLKEEMGKHHAEHINDMLTEDVTTVAGNDIESLDRITTGNNSMTSGTHYDAGDEDIYSIDRSANTWAFAEDSADSGSANRTLSLDHLDETFRLIWERGGNPKVMLTGYDTLMRITYNGVPIIPTKEMASDGISRVYMLDTDYVYFSTAKPTQYFESGIETGDPFAINRLGQEGLYRTMGEVWTTFFGGQGSIRDLQ